MSQLLTSLEGSITSECGANRKSQKSPSLVLICARVLDNLYAQNIPCANWNEYSWKTVHVCKACGSYWSIQILLHTCGNTSENDLSSYHFPSVFIKTLNITPCSNTLLGFGAAWCPTDPQWLLEGRRLVLSIFDDGGVGAAALAAPHLPAAAGLPVFIGGLSQLGSHLHQMVGVGLHQCLRGEQAQVWVGTTQREEPEDKFTNALETIATFSHALIYVHLSV